MRDANERVDDDLYSQRHSVSGNEQWRSPMRVTDTRGVGFGKSRVLSEPSGVAAACSIDMYRCTASAWPCRLLTADEQQNSH